MTQDLQGLFEDGGGNKLMLELSSKQGKLGRRKSFVGVTNKVWTTSFKKRNTTWDASLLVETK
jgi:hypothetical protein